MGESYEDRAHKELRIESWSNAARTLLIRGSTPGGPFAEQHTTNADRSLAENTFELHGLPTYMQISPLTVPVRRGECYIRATLMMDGEPVLRLSAGYLTDSKTISWPPGVFEGFTEGPGLIRTVTGTNPAAGAEFAETVPTNTRWKLRSLLVQLVADVNVATRRVNLYLDDGATDFIIIPAGVTQIASETWTYAWWGTVKASSEVGGMIEVNLLSGLELAQGSRLRSATSNLQAGDNFTAPILSIEEWIEE